MNKCCICGKEFEGRADAKCCSSTCRSKFSRLSVATGVGATDKSPVSVAEGLSVATDKLMLVSASDPKVIAAGVEISKKKKVEMLSSPLPAVSLDEPCKVPNSVPSGEVYLDLEKDLHLDLKKDLGITAWTKDGIFIRDDITIEQVRNIRRVVEAKHGWPHRTYDNPETPYSTAKLAGVGV